MCVAGLNPDLPLKPPSLSMLPKAYLWPLSPTISLSLAWPGLARPSPQQAHDEETDLDP